MIQDYVASGRVRLATIAGSRNPADIGTKAVSRGVLEELRADAGVCPIPGASATQMCDRELSAVQAATSSSPAVDVEAARRILMLLTAFAQLAVGKASQDKDEDSDSWFVQIVIGWSTFCVLLGIVLARRMSGGSAVRPALVATGTQTLEPWASQASSSAVQDGILYVSLVQGECYHSNKDCFGLKHAAKVAEKRQCKICKKYQ